MEHCVDDLSDGRVIACLRNDIRESVEHVR